MKASHTLFLSFCIMSTKNDFPPLFLYELQGERPLKMPRLLIPFCHIGHLKEVKS